MDFYLFENEGVDLDDLHVLKIGFKNGLGIGLGNIPTDLPEVCLRLAQGLPEVGPKFA